MKTAAKISVRLAIEKVCEKFLEANVACWLITLNKHWCSIYWRRKSLLSHHRQMQHQVKKTFDVAFTLLGRQCRTLPRLKERDYAILSLRYKSMKVKLFSWKTQKATSTTSTVTWQLKILREFSLRWVCWLKIIFRLSGLCVAVKTYSYP